MSFSKADGLRQLVAIGVNVPDFKELSQHEVLQIVKDKDCGLIGEKIVSVRSCGSVSTAGRMKTVLNVTDENLATAIETVYKSTQSQRLQNYLQLKNCNDFEWSIIIQEMILINQKGDFSGVLVTHSPINREEMLFGEVIEASNGDVLMNGSKTPESLKILPAKLLNALKSEVKKIQDYLPLQEAIGKYKEIEFVIKDGVVWILQVRAQRMNSEMILDEKEVDGEIIGYGTSITRKTAQGKISTNINDNFNRILFLEKTDFEDVKSVLNSNGLITKKGGQLCHAASIARDFNIPTIVGVGEMEVKEEETVFLSKKGLVYVLNHYNQIKK